MIGLQQYRLQEKKSTKLTDIFKCSATDGHHLNDKTIQYPDMTAIAADESVSCCNRTSDNRGNVTIRRSLTSASQDHEKPAAKRLDVKLCETEEYQVYRNKFLER